MLDYLPLPIIAVAFVPSVILLIGFIIVRRVLKKSRRIDPITQAEIDQIKDLTEANIQTKSFEQALQTQFGVAVDGSKGNLHRVEEQFTKFLDELKNRSSEAQANNQGLIVSQINKLFEGFEQNLSNFLTQTQQQSVQSIDLELKASRQLIETYKQEQLKLIDENIVAILERTLNIVLTKKLTLKDQIDLVYEALEKAKKENFIS